MDKFTPRPGDCCGKCQFFQVIPGIPTQSGAAAGACRRYPPTAFIIGTASTSSVVDPKNPQANVVPVVRGFFPVLSSNDWCGEFALKIEGSA